MRESESWLQKLEKDYEANRKKIRNRRPRSEWRGSPILIIFWGINNIKLFGNYFMEVFWIIFWRSAKEISLIVGAVLIGLSIGGDSMEKFYIGVGIIIGVIAIESISKIKLFYYPDIHEYSAFVRAKWDKQFGHLNDKTDNFSESKLAGKKRK